MDAMEELEELRLKGKIGKPNDGFFDLLNKEEELHDDLKNYVSAGKVFMQLHHPLMIDIPYDKQKNALINASYQQKLHDLKMWERQGAWSRYIGVYERPYRLEEFIKIDNRLIDGEYWDIAGWLWEDTENQWQYLSEWQDVLSSKRNQKECFMNQDEQKFLKALPDEVEIYRGCFEGINDEGLSWTLDKSIAEMFSQHRHFKREDDWESIILSQTVSKEDIFAVKLGRKESEVILKM
tara:strand:+ start:745 stop:1455 length:711 start_codon:yes stop_codon:yes gene_type:complete